MQSISHITQKWADAQCAFSSLLQGPLLATNYFLSKADVVNSQCDDATWGGDGSGSDQKAKK